jgi:hypothetical protein
MRRARFSSAGSLNFSAPTVERSIWRGERFIEPGVALLASASAQDQLI